MTLEECLISDSRFEVKSIVVYLNLNSKLYQIAFKMPFNSIDDFVGFLGLNLLESDVLKVSDISFNFVNIEVKLRKKERK